MRVLQKSAADAAAMRNANTTERAVRCPHVFEYMYMFVPVRALVVRVAPDARNYATAPHESIAFRWCGHNAFDVGGWYYYFRVMGHYHVYGIVVGGIFVGYEVISVELNTRIYSKNMPFL